MGTLVLSILLSATVTAPIILQSEEQGITRDVHLGYQENYL